MRRLEQLFPPLALPSFAVASFAVMSLAVLALPASADWIQTREGALVETRGPWKVKGPVVVFTSASGTLSSLRLAEVDLDASAVATVEAQQKAEAPEPEGVREPVLVLTNKDIPRAPSVFAETAEEEAEDGQSKPAEGEESSPADAEPVTVISWQPVKKAGGGLELTGTLMNMGENIASNLRVRVTLYGEGGDLLGSSNAFLSALSLAPTSSAKFRALFPDVTESSITPEFDVRNSTIRVEAVLMEPGTGNES